MYHKFNKNVTLLAKNQEYVSQKCEKSYFSTKYRISAQNHIRPSEIYSHQEISQSIATRTVNCNQVLLLYYLVQ